MGEDKRGKAIREPCLCACTEEGLCEDRVGAGRWGRGLTGSQAWWQLGLPSRPPCHKERSVCYLSSLVGGTLYGCPSRLMWPLRASLVGIYRGYKCLHASKFHPHSRPNPPFSRPLNTSVNLLTTAHELVAISQTTSPSVPSTEERECT